MIGILRDFKSKASGPFVIESPHNPRPSATYSYIRGKEHFDCLYAWLRSQGIDSIQPTPLLPPETDILGVERGLESLGGSAREPSSSGHSAARAVIAVEGGAVRVFLADDHRVIRESLRVLLESTPSLEIVGEAGDLHGLMSAARPAAPDVIVIDLQFGDTLGYEAIIALRNTVPTVRIVVLSMFEGSPWKERALAAGANAYLS